MNKYYTMTKAGRNFTGYAVGLFFALYPFLCHADKYVKNSTAIFFLLVISALSCVAVIVRNKTFRITAADALFIVSFGWCATVYFIAAYGRIEQVRMYEFTALGLTWFSIRNSPHTQAILLFIAIGAFLQILLCCAQL